MFHFDNFELILYKCIVIKNELNFMKCVKKWMSSENDNNDKCWNVTNNIINNADYTHKMYKKTVWF